MKNHYFAKRNHANSKPTARNGGFLLYRKRIIKTKVLTANYLRQNDYKNIKTDIITHIPCCNIEKKRIIKSAIQKTFILVFILKHGDN